MTHGVVDTLEVIQVDQDDAQRRSVALRSVHFTAQPFDDDAVVPQAGQAIVLGKVAHLLAGTDQLGLFALEICGAPLHCVFKMLLLAHQLPDPFAPDVHKADQQKQPKDHL